MTFALNIMTSAELAAEAAQARAGQIKAECTATILAILDEHTQASLLAAAVSGALDEGDMATFRAGQAWIEAVKAECRAAIVAQRDPVWPVASDAVLDLARRY